MFTRDTDNLPSPVASLSESPADIAQQEEEIIALFEDISKPVPDKLITASDIIRRATQQAPRRASNCTDLFSTLLNTHSASITENAYRAIYTVTEVTPELTHDLSAEILKSLRNTPDTNPHSKAEVIAAVAHVSDKIEIDTPISEFDPLFAKLLKHGDKVVQVEIAGKIGTIVAQKPSGCTFTLDALSSALKSSSAKVRLEAGRSLALLAEQNPTALDDWGEAHSQVLKFRADPEIPDKEAQTIVSIIGEKVQ